jgi:hypothetical protein
MFHEANVSTRRASRWPLTASTVELTHTKIESNDPAESASKDEIRLRATPLEKSESRTPGVPPPRAGVG